MLHSVKVKKNTFYFFTLKVDTNRLDKEGHCILNPDLNLEEWILEIGFV